MASFEQFISSFSADSRDKGEQFENVLCEWFLREHPEFRLKFKKIWRYKEWPHRWHGQDLGTDLIAEDTEGKICAIQSKFYSESNTIPKGDVDSFLTDSAREVIDYRLLIATTDKIGLNATITIEGQEKPVHLFLLNDFLESQMEWPSSYHDLRAPRLQPKVPRPHQKEAIDNVVSHLGDRGQLIMACGTGKTLVGQRVAEKLEAHSTLVLLPSLLLMSKTIRDWAIDANIPFVFLPVCSDSTVQEKSNDEARYSTSDLSFEPTTNPEEIAKFLAREGKKVVFATYQSSPKLAEAFHRYSLSPFDLIIADEAHRCAGNMKSAFGTVLNADELPAIHRLFMTATPRIYKANIRKQAANNETQIASMDDESAFGPELHTLAFGDAIERKLLSDYRVVVIGVNNPMLQEMVTNRVLVKTDNEIIDDARSLAIRVGLVKAIKDYDLKRVISFHNRVRSARQFSNDFDKFINWMVESAKPSGRITYEYVSGLMPTSERANKLRSLGKLEQEERYVLANARCLSEGVDVPSLDGIAFVDPKRSEIDIVQAVGRVMRLDRSSIEKVGTIIIPVFIEDEGNPEHALESSNFDQVWKVVSALRSHDERLREELDNFRIQLGRKKKIDFPSGKIHLDVHHTIDESFVAGFQAKLVEATTAPWLFWFGLLQQYVAEHNHCFVLTRYVTKDGRKLGTWCGTQMNLRKNGRLSEERIRLLDSLGFIWEKRNEEWDAHFSALQSFSDSNGHCNVALGFHSNDGYNLRAWLNMQFTQYDQGRLSQDCIKRLKSIGVNFERWEEGFSALEQYQKSTGHSLVPPSFVTENGFPLGLWLKTQKADQKLAQLSAEKISRLESLFVYWDKAVAAWEAAFGRLQRFKKTYGHSYVHRSFFAEDNFRLGEWTAKQRASYLKGDLSEKQIERLEDLGFIWDDSIAEWEAGFFYLQQFREIHGHCEMLKDHRTKNGFNLGRWLSMQKSAYMKGMLSRDRFLRLEPMGVFPAQEDVSEKDQTYQYWEAGFTALLNFQVSYGHIDVPRHGDNNNMKLRQWKMAQEKSHKKGELPNDRARQLESLGFRFAQRKEKQIEELGVDENQERIKWETSFMALQNFRESYGDSRVPTLFKTRSGLHLGRWLKKQKASHWKGELSDEKVERLTALGVVLDKWSENLTALQLYRRLNGHCNVPITFKTDDGIKLGIWLQRQVQLYNNNALSDSRITLLKKMGIRLDKA